MIRRTSARESANARYIDPQERCRKLQVQRRGNIDQIDKPRPREAVVQRFGRWDGWPWQKNAEHADRLPIQRRHQEEQRQEAVNRGSSSSQLDGQHRHARDHDERRRTDEEDRQSTERLTAIGVKEAIAAAITSIVGAQITNPILRTTDRSDFRTVDEYDLHKLLSAANGGVERPPATAIR